MEAFTPENSIKGWAERAIMIMDQEAQGLFSLGKFPNQLPGLLRNPDLIGVGGDTRKMNLARTQFDEEEYIDGLEPDSFDSEKIASQDLILVVGHEMTPTDGAISNKCWLDTVTTEHIAYRWLRNLAAQLEKFTHNLAISHARVLLSDLDYQVFSFLTDGWSSTLVFVGISPFLSNQVPIPDSAGEALPAQYGFRPEDTDDTPELICSLVRRLLELVGQNAQGQFLNLAGLDGMLFFALQNGELLSQNEDF